jgi:hypothetical protein
LDEPLAMNSIFVPGELRAIAREATRANFT